MMSMFAKSEIFSKSWATWQYVCSLLQPNVYILIPPKQRLLGLIELHNNIPGSRNNSKFPNVIKRADFMLERDLSIDYEIPQWF